MPNSQEARFDRLETMIEKGFAALAQDVADSRTEIMEIKAEVASTNSVVAQLRTEMHEGFADIQSELKDIRNRLDALEFAVHNISGYAKEIDHLIERVSAIERHLGLRANIAA